MKDRRGRASLRLKPRSSTTVSGGPSAFGSRVPRARGASPRRLSRGADQGFPSPRRCARAHHAPSSVSFVVRTPRLAALTLPLLSLLSFSHRSNDPHAARRCVGSFLPSTLFSFSRQRQKSAHKANRVFVCSFPFFDYVCSRLHTATASPSLFFRIHPSGMPRLLRVCCVSRPPPVPTTLKQLSRAHASRETARLKIKIIKTKKSMS